MNVCLKTRGSGSNSHADQSDAEKKVTIPAMDLIYNRARAVVVVLGDICFNQSGIDIFLSFLKQ